jgi:hypothetical protein
LSASYTAAWPPGQSEAPEKIDLPAFYGFRGAEARTVERRPAEFREAANADGHA